MQKIIEHRIARIFSEAKGADSILIANNSEKDPNFKYVTGFVGGLFESSFLILNRDGVKLITYPLEYETAVQQNRAGLQIVMAKSGKEVVDMLKEELRDRVVGINGDFLVYRHYDMLNSVVAPRGIINVAGAFQKARLIKDTGEIEQIRKAATITKAAMEEIKNRLRVGMTEKQLAREFDELSAHMGSCGPSFDTIVCFGPNASMPHHAPDDTRLKYGDLVLIDAGALIGNYCSDISRTFIFGSEPSRISDHDKKKEMIRIVSEAQRKAIDEIRVGAEASAIHNVAEDHINNADGGRYNGSMIHSLGHSLGIEVHDGVGLSSVAIHRLELNMVVTVEPGIYVPGFGGVRIEDDVRVRMNSAVIL